MKKKDSFESALEELENILERATTLCEHNIIEKHDLHLQESAAAYQHPAGEGSAVRFAAAAK